ncbi:MAG: type II toxin-antitoxin system Phd/YefM family antitoxin [Candidatus Nomurabacteria bacterium]|jgi:prevent-host-death family protein|nr:type II toxin-antitoxin system Phd/YefM family antitoxin [Candidatus Nomurabacteria bacterium]
MATILPISDLRNYTEVLNEVDVDRPVYLTRNGRGAYVISKIDDYDREVTAEELLKIIKQGEKSFDPKTAKTNAEIASRYGIKL